MRFLRISSDGDTLRIVERTGAEASPVAPEDVDQAIEEIVGHFGDEAREAMRDALDADLAQVPTEMPRWSHCFVDPEARLWVKRFRSPRAPADEPAEWEVYDPVGRYLGRLDLPLGGSPAPRFRGGLLVGVGEDELGVPHVAVLEVNTEAEPPGEFVNLSCRVCDVELELLAVLGWIRRERSYDPSVRPLPGSDPISDTGIDGQWPGAGGRPSGRPGSIDTEWNGGGRTDRCSGCWSGMSTGSSQGQRGFIRTGDRNAYQHPVIEAIDLETGTVTRSMRIPRLLWGFAGPGPVVFGPDVDPAGNPLFCVVQSHAAN